MYGTIEYGTTPYGGLIGSNITIFVSERVQGVDSSIENIVLIVEETLKGKDALKSNLSVKVFDKSTPTEKDRINQVIKKIDKAGTVDKNKELISMMFKDGLLSNEKGLKFSYDMLIVDKLENKELLELFNLIREILKPKTVDFYRITPKNVDIVNDKIKAIGYTQIKPRLIK